MMYESGYGMDTHTAITQQPIRFTCFAFVDNTDTIQTGLHLDTPSQQLIPLFQEALDCWEGGHWASGGLLSQKKASGT